MGADYVGEELADLIGAVLVEVVEDEAPDGFDMVRNRVLEMRHALVRERDQNAAGVAGALALGQQTPLFHAGDLVGGARAVPAELVAQLAETQRVVFRFRQRDEDREFRRRNLAALLEAVVDGAGDLVESGQD